VPTPDVFISYRREPDGKTAGRLHESLVRRLGKDHVVIDRETIERQVGRRFGDAIAEAIRGCRVLLVVIGRDWAIRTGPDGQPRLQSEDDWVRTEVAAGLARRGMLVVPVLVDGATLPRPEQLPADVRGLLDRGAARIDDERWSDDVDRLVRELRVMARNRPARDGSAAAFALLAALAALAAAVISQLLVHTTGLIGQHAIFWALALGILSGLAWSSADDDTRGRASVMGLVGGAVAGATGAAIYIGLKHRVLGFEVAHYNYDIGAAVIGSLVGVIVLARVAAISRPAAGAIGGVVCALAAQLGGQIPHHTTGAGQGAAFVLMAVATVGSVALASRWEPRPPAVDPRTPRSPFERA
jgi:hypothetical protein